MNTYSVVIDFRRGYSRAERCLAALEKLAERLDGEDERWFIVDRPRLYQQLCLASLFYFVLREPFG